MGHRHRLRQRIPTTEAPLHLYPCLFPKCFSKLQFDGNHPKGHWHILRGGVDAPVYVTSELRGSYLYLGGDGEEEMCP